MIEKLLDIGKLILAILPFALLCLSAKTVNLPKIDRSKQFFIPVIAVVYVIVAMCLMNWLNQKLLGLIYALPKYISSLAKQSWVPGNVAVYVNQFSKWVAKVLKELNMGFWVFFISNTVIISVYLILKKFFFEKVHYVLMERQAHIEEQLWYAAETERKANILLEEYSETLAHAEEEKRRILREARKEADLRAAGIVEKAQKEAEELAVRTHEKLVHEEEKLVRRLQEEIGELAVLAASQVLGRELTMASDSQAELVNQVLEEAKESKWKNQAWH